MQSRQRQTFAEAAEELRQAWREFLIALGFGRLAIWLARVVAKLTKEGRK
ncbi:hypothetical protein DFP94_101506 [Fontibacillus phaseoli]|uniref:Uncharacterized protein n=1 Tax=Fontibacillus phaseoli TaxID=1416533 RepID=A0A369BR29_9BACL|nr:hypothetical protein [Fontibacillus phaseoli]RCX22917.1 hypothetical protein DFP94_101506 [Fontibacillus phaseoli]